MISVSPSLKLAPACFRPSAETSGSGPVAGQFFLQSISQEAKWRPQATELRLLRTAENSQPELRFGYKHAIIQPWLTARMVSSVAGNTYSSAREGGIVDYYVIEVSRWCIALHRETWMRLTYRRDYLPERELWRDFLVSAEPLPGTNERRLQ